MRWFVDEWKKAKNALAVSSLASIRKYLIKILCVNEMRTNSLLFWLQLRAPRRPCQRETFSPFEPLETAIVDTSDHEGSETKRPSMKPNGVVVVVGGGDGENRTRGSFAKMNWFSAKREKITATDTPPLPLPPPDITAWNSDSMWPNSWLKFSMEALADWLIYCLNDYHNFLQLALCVLNWLQGFFRSDFLFFHSTHNSIYRRLIVS